MNFLIQAYNTKSRDTVAIAVKVDAREVANRLNSIVDIKLPIKRGDDEWINNVVLDSRDFNYRVRHISRLHEIRVVNINERSIVSCQI